MYLSRRRVEHEIEPTILYRVTGNTQSNTRKHHKTSQKGLKCEIFFDLYACLVKIRVVGMNCLTIFVIIPTFTTASPSPLTLLCHKRLVAVTQPSFHVSNLGLLSLS